MAAFIMTAVVAVAAITGAVSLRRSFSASAQYAASLAEQTRLLDYLTRDLRRAVAPPTIDPDDQGLRIVVPDDRSDTATQKIAYRFLNGSITRDDPLHVRGGPVTIASGMAAFPTVEADPADATGTVARYRVTFHPVFRPLAEASRSKVIILP